MAVKHILPVLVMKPDQVNILAFCFAYILPVIMPEFIIRKLAAVFVFIPKVFTIGGNAFIKW